MNDLIVHKKEHPKDTSKVGNRSTLAADLSF